MQYNAIQCNATPCRTMQYNAIQCNAIQCNTMQYNAICLPTYNSLIRAGAGSMAWRTGAHCETDVSGETILRWERKTDACCTLVARDFYDSNEARLAEAVDLDQVFPDLYGIHTVMTDATNKTIIHQEKCQVTSCSSKCRHTCAVTGQRLPLECSEDYGDVLIAKGAKAADTQGLV